MSHELHNTFRVFGETWLGVPGWAWLLIVVLVVGALVWALRDA